MRFAWYSWWQWHAVSIVSQKYELKPTHASWLEAFRFNRVADLPDENKLPPHVPGIMDAQQARKTYGDGNFGGPYFVSDMIMDEIFAVALADILQLLKFEE